MRIQHDIYINEVLFVNSLFTAKPVFVNGVLLRKLLWTRVASLTSSLLAVFSLASFGICLNFEVLGKQLGHQSDNAVATFLKFLGNYDL